MGVWGGDDGEQGAVPKRIPALGCIELFPNFKHIRVYTHTHSDALLSHWNAGETHLHCHIRLMVSLSPPSREQAVCVQQGSSRRISSNG